jgi:hypothetical protein
MWGSHLVIPLEASVADQRIGMGVSVSYRNIRTERVLPDERGLEKSLRRCRMPCSMPDRCHPSRNRDTTCYDIIVTAKRHDYVKVSL